MATHAGVGVSHHRNPKVAGQEAVQMAMKLGGMTKPGFVFLFSTVGYPQSAVVTAVREATGGAPVCGCSGEGVIAPGLADESNFAVAALALASDEFRFHSGLATGLKESSFDAGQKVGDAVKPLLDETSRALFILADGLTVNFDQLLAGLENVLPKERGLPIYGGVSADNWAFKKTYQYCDDRVVSDGVAWALLSGDVRVASAVTHGCVAIGGRRKVTRSAGNVIYEIDGRPALDVLKEYLVGEEIDSWDKAVINLSLGFRSPSYMADYDEYVIRFIPGRDTAAGSFSIQTEVKEGTDVWMTRRDAEKIQRGIAAAGESLKETLAGEKPKLVFQFDCCGRGKVILREQQKTQALVALQNEMGGSIPWIGFYTLGEIGPVGGHNCFHNYTVVLSVLY